MNVSGISVVENKLNSLHKDAQKDYLRIGKGIVKSIFRPIGPADFEHTYLPISKEQGDWIRQLIVDNDCREVVEFGTSFGISTIYLADAVRQTGGKVITTELLPSKVKRAEQNMEDVGLREFVDFRVGDALKTLQGHSTKIDFLFLDGWKDLYIPLFKLLEPHFHSDTLIYADNIDMARSYANHVFAKRDKYFSRIIHGGKAMLTQVA